MVYLMIKELSPDADEVKDIRQHIDDLLLPSSTVDTRWLKCLPIKINVFTWRARLDRLPTRCNLLYRGVEVDSSICPICGQAPEDIIHLLFKCDVSASILRRICHWWNINFSEVNSFMEWYDWFSSVRLSSKLKQMVEGSFYVAWWHLWQFPQLIRLQ